MTAEARICPRCGSPMVLRTARQGRYDGQRFWGCSAYPTCRATAQVDVDPPVEAAGAVEWAVSPAGASAQAEFERRRARNRERMRRQWPFALGIGLILTAIVYAVVMATSDQPILALTIAGSLAITQVVGFLQLSPVRAWGVGAEGERKTAAFLEPLGEAGFVILHDRKVPGWGGNLDHVAIGPSGIWAIETKNLAGKVVIRGEVLRIGGYRRDKIIEQVRQEATIVQVVLAESLGRLGLRVTPVICLHRGELPFFNKTVRGVRLASGRQLVRLLRDGEERLSSQQVVTLAREADRVLRPAVG